MGRRRVWPVCAALLLAGCGAGTSDDRARAVPSPSVTSAAECPSLKDSRPLPAGVTPTAAVRCEEKRERVDGDGVWLVRTTERATAIAPLVEALRLDSIPPTDGMCTMELRLPTEVLMEIEGDVRPVSPPTSACGQTRDEVREAWFALTWTTTTRTPIEQILPEPAVTAGCDLWKDMLAVEAATAKPGGPGVVVPAGPIQVCRYSSVYPPGWTETAGMETEVTVEGGFTARDAAASGIATALAEAGPAKPCTARHGTFAVLQAASDTAYVELDGCLRILAPDGTLRQGTPRLARLLTS